MNEKQMAEYLEQSRKRVYSRTHEQQVESAKRVMTLIAKRTLEVNHDEHDKRVIYAKQYLRGTK